MTAYWWYILKVSICIIVFYSFYMLMLRNCTFFLLNRLYLIFGLLLSFVIPVLNLSIFEGQSNSVFTNNIYTSLIEPDYTLFHPQNLKNDAITINYSMIVAVIYFTVISILFLKLLFSILKISRIITNSQSYQIGNKKIIQTDLVQPFSFFNKIFLPTIETNSLIIEHEMAHIEQWHWFDLILIEIISMLLWFNPFVVLYKNSLKLQHEYLADTHVIKDDTQVENYLYCMLKHIQVVSYNGPVSQFYCKTIKKRVIMITKNKTSVKYLGLYVLALPLVGFMLFAFTSNNALLVPKVDNPQNDRNQPSIYPVDSKKITQISDYGERINPLTKKNDFHFGMDLAIPEGEQVISTADGIVVDTKFDSAKGNYVRIQHNETFSTLYSHLKSVVVKIGDKMEKGEVVGYSGNTGSSTTGSHLHYEVLENGKNVNPKDYLPK